MAQHYIFYKCQTHRFWLVKKACLLLRSGSGTVVCLEQVVFKKFSLNVPMACLPALNWGLCEPEMLIIQIFLTSGRKSFPLLWFSVLGNSKLVS